MVTHAGSVQQSIAAEADRLRTPWWYRYVKSWRWRMWLETGVWVPRPYVVATNASVTPLRASTAADTPVMATVAVQEAA